MKSVIEYKCGHAIDWKKAFQLTTDIIRYNHYGATAANGNTAENLIHRAAQMGVTVRKYEHSVEIMTRYGEPECLSYAYDILTASKKRHPTPKKIRSQQKADQEAAEWRNIGRYDSWLKATETNIGAEARNIRRLRTTETQDAKNAIRLAQLISEYENERKSELQARLNYPKQITVDLLKRAYSNRYRDIEQELPF